MKSKIFNIWIAMWMILVMSITIFNPFELFPLLVMGIFLFFLTWFGYQTVAPQVDWSDWYDWVSAFNVIMFFGSLMAFVLPCLYEVEIAHLWDTWNRWMILIWLISINISLGTSLYKEYSSSGKWSLILIAMLAIMVVIFISMVLK